MKYMGEADYILTVKIQGDRTKKFDFISRNLRKENIGILSNE